MPCKDDRKQSGNLKFKTEAAQRFAVQVSDTTKADLKTGAGNKTIILDVFSGFKINFGNHSFSAFDLIMKSA